MFKKFLPLFFLLFSDIVFSQTETITQKEINQKTQTWISLNSINKFSDRWGIVADVHIRWDEFLVDNNFYFLRGGVTYIPNKLVSLTAGYAHMWLAPSNPDWTTYSDENRIYQQVNLNTVAGKVGIVQRIRNEQRWQEKIVNDEETGEYRFTNRIRYLFSLNIPIFKKSTMPVLVVSDEILLQIGEEVIYNTFDQNRFFVGIKQKIDKNWSFDFGYMNVYQQKYSGYQYDMNHTLRLFFYLSTVIKKNELPENKNDSGDE